MQPGVLLDPVAPVRPPTRAQGGLNERRAEWAGLVFVLIAAFAARIVNLDRLEPNVLPDEADHLALMYRILAGQGPGPFDLSWDGNPALSLYPSLLVVWLLGEPLGSDYAALRLASGLASLGMLAAFYAVCRHKCSPFAALGATGLLACSPWTLFFSRNGEVNVFVALYALLAVWSLQHAVVGRSWWPWVSAGFWAGLGWYGFLAGVFILPTLVAATAAWMATQRERRRALLAGSLILVAAFTLTVLPRVPTLIERWGDVQRYVEGRSIVRTTRPEQLPGVLAGQAESTLRAFLLLDPTLDGNERYLAPDRAALDSISGTLYVVGLALAIARSSDLALWLALLLVPLLPTQVLTTGIPDLARAIVALPAFFLFVGVALDRALRSTPYPSLAHAVLIVSVTWIGVANWRDYARWMATPEAARAREPAVYYDEFSAWRVEQQRRARNDEPGMTVTAWREQHPRVSHAGTGIRGGLGRTQTPEAVDLRAEHEIDVGRGPSAPRGVTANARGDVLVVDQGGRLHRVETDRVGLSPLPRSRSASQLEAWDLASGSDGFVYIVDPRHNVVLKSTIGGEIVATFGERWGMYRPRGIDLAPDGRLYIADTGRDRVIVATTDGALLGTIGSGTLRGELEQPTDVAVDDSGRLFVALPTPGRVEVLNLGGSRLGGWSIAVGDTIEGPHLAITPQGSVVVSEPSDHRVRVFAADGRPLGGIKTSPSTPFGVAVAGHSLYVTDPARGKLIRIALDWS